jgi:hypothetical protein
VIVSNLYAVIGMMMGIEGTVNTNISFQMNEEKKLIRGI